MSDRIHDDEPDTGETVVRALLAAECSQWADRPIGRLRNSGTDNAMWRVRLDREPDVVVRLPIRPGSAAKVLPEAALLDEVASSAVAAVVATPSVRHVGAPHEVFPHHWSVLAWLDGTDAWTARHALAAPADALALDLARAVVAIRSVIHIDAPSRSDGDRGGPTAPLRRSIDWWLDEDRWHASRFIDVEQVRTIVDEGCTRDEDPVTPVFTHGDLIPGNLLVEEGRLSAIIDWGSAGWADPAQDLTPAWAVLDGDARSTFRDAIGVDDAEWSRARLIALQQAVAGVVYYVPRRHPLGNVMARTLTRILDDT